MSRNNQGWSRRKFISTIGSTGAAMMLLPHFSWAENIDPKVAAIVAKTMGIDTHNHTDVPLDIAELPGPQLDLSGEMKKAGLSAIVMTFATDYKRNVQPGEAYQRFLNGITAMDKVLEANSIKRAFNLSDLQAAHKKHKPIVIQSVEGCHFLEGQLDKVDVAYKRGVRQLGLLHDSDASTPLGDVYTNAAKFGGLTAFGADVIRKCNELGILIDLTHASNDTINAALKVSTKPMLLSHTGLDTQLGQNANMAKMMRPRLISKDEAKTVADAGGVVGVWTHLADTPLEYAQNIKAMVDVAGIDHVCIGTDTKLTPAYRYPASSGFGPRPAGSDTGHRPGGPPSGNNGQRGPGNDKRVGERTNEAWQDQKTGFYYAVVEALLQTGFTEAEIGKVGGGNFCRVFNSATTGKG